MNFKQLRAASAMIHSIAKGRWSDDLPDWAERVLLHKPSLDTENGRKALFAAEVLMMQWVTSGTKFNREGFINATFLGLP